MREKVQNMARWLQTEGLPELQLPTLNELALTTFAHTLHNAYAESIKKRDFTGLLADKENLPGEVETIVHFVESRASLHDKFWRYLELFSEVASMHS